MGSATLHPSYEESDKVELTRHKKTGPEGPVSITQSIYFT